MQQPETSNYAKCIEASKRVRWDIDQDVIRGRTFDLSKKFLPDGLTFVSRLDFLTPAEALAFSHVQGRTYANMFGLVERFINAKVLELTEQYWLGDQVALEALVRFSDEELKHQALFRKLETLTAQGMAPGYTFSPDPNEVAKAVLGSSTWAVLALTCHIELFTLAHYRQSIESGPELSDLYRDVFLFHWKEESQHALLDEYEWQREHDKLTPAQREQAVGEFISLVGAVDGILQGQAKADAAYFSSLCQRTFSADQTTRLHDVMLAAYRWQYIVSGVKETRFAQVLAKLTTPEQLQRVVNALGPLMG